MTARRPTLLILSFSTLARDARLLRQIRAFATAYDVTTCGFGPQPVPNVPHVEVTPGVPRRRRLVQAMLLRLRLYRVVHALHPYVGQARRALAGRRFDAVLANDIDAAKVAIDVADGERVHLDLHEFWPGIHDDVDAWKKLRAPYYEWQLRRWGRRTRSATTVNQALADRYERDYGIRCDVVVNATEWHDLSPAPVSAPIRLVHSGAANPNRRIELMMHAVAACSSDVTLDLYLMGEGTDYYRELETLAAQVGDRVRVLAPVPHAELVRTLNGYDVGLSFFPPTTTNITYGLPNKLFDYVQARLAIVTGPTPPMIQIVESHDLGLVAKDFTQEAFVDAIDSLSVATIAAWKRHAHTAAEPLSAERQNGGWFDGIETIVKGAHRG